MGSFTATNFYIADRIPEENSFKIFTNSWAPVTLEKNGPSDPDTFRVGDTIELFRDGVFSDLYIYRGTFENGVVLYLHNDDSDSMYLATNDSYPTGTTFQINSVPFPVCFVKGTMITTSRGPVAIEALIKGDSVQGSSGWRTVKWVGWRKYSAASFLTQEGKSRIAPVRVRTHAIADNIPSIDLLISPWHHLLVGGKLVRAGDLVNGSTITQETHATEVEYYHVELDQFDVVMAHGMYSESYADGGNRDFFQNVDVTSLRPEDKIRRRASRPGFDHLVLRKGEELAAIQKHIAKRAEEISRASELVQKVA